VTVHVKPLFYK